MTSRKQMRVLLVEDNPGDVDLVRKALADATRPLHITVAADGVEALDVLEADSADLDLVILDLNLPKKDGRELLQDMKNDPRLRHIPVVVFSSSEASRDLADAYQLQANCFVTKPVDLDDFLAAVRGIDAFWLRLAKLPPPLPPPPPAPLSQDRSSPSRAAPIAIPPAAASAPASTSSSTSPPPTAAAST